MPLRGAAASRCSQRCSMSSRNRFACFSSSNLATSPAIMFERSAITFASAASSLSGREPRAGNLAHRVAHVRGRLDLLRVHLQFLLHVLVRGEQPEIRECVPAEPRDPLRFGQPRPAGVQTRPSRTVLPVNGSPTSSFHLANWSAVSTPSAFFCRAATTASSFFAAAAGSVADSRMVAASLRNASWIAANSLV